MVGQPVHRAERDEDAAVLAHQPRILADGHAGGALHDDPMRGAMNMTLQAEDAAGLDHD
jgi:hypothetical protein